MSKFLTFVHPDIQKKFQSGFQWILFGSIMYETGKIVHYFLLFKTLSSIMYGMAGSLFSLIYLTTYMADLGASNSLPPFLHIFKQDKSIFKRFLLFYSLMPHLPILVICATGITIFIAYKFPSICMSLLICVLLLVILETIRSFLRVLLHITFQAKRAVVTELVIFFAYITIIWVPYFWGKMPLTLERLFFTHLIDSCSSVICLLLLVKAYYVSLPNSNDGESSKFPAKFGRRLVLTRMFNYLLRVSRNMFTSNFLTPFFAIKFGVASAGFFYFASTLVNSMQIVVKSVINYAGGALLASVKDHSQSAKKEAFQTLSQKVMYVIIPVIVMLLVNHRSILKLASLSDPVSNTLVLSFLFFVISFSEFISVLYEQFYIIEEAANRLFFFKLFELVFFYSLIVSDIVTSSVIALLGLIAVRFVSLAIIALSAFQIWGVKLNFKVKPFYWIFWFFIAILVALFLQLRILV